MAKQSRAQRKTVERVVHEYKQGELKRGRGAGKVKSPRQAVAIALSKAGASRRQDPKSAKRRPQRTKDRAAKGQTARARQEGRKGRSASAAGHGKTKGELYAEARRRGVAGRSKMSKSQLAKAVGQR